MFGRSRNQREATDSSMDLAVQSMLKAEPQGGIAIAAGLWQRLAVPEHIVSPRESRREKLWREVSAFSPQVKQGLIAASVALVLALGSCLGVFVENSRLRTKVHEMELELLPFRNLAVQEFNKADAQAMTRLAESMRDLKLQNGKELEQVDRLLKEVDRLKNAEAEAAEGEFKPLSEANGNRFLDALREFFKAWPSITNVGFVVDTTETKRRLWADQITKLLTKSTPAVPVTSGLNMDNGRYDLNLFFNPRCGHSLEGLATALTNLFRPPIKVSPETNQPFQISIRLMREPKFDLNGVIYFDRN
jgi:hypothetical protein